MPVAGGHFYTLPLTTPVIPSSIPVADAIAFTYITHSTSETSQRPQNRTRQQHYPKTQQGQRQSRVGTCAPKRLAETKHMSQAEWLASDAKALVAVTVPQPGLNPICRCWNCG